MNASSDYFDDLTHYTESIRTAEQVSAVISAFLTFINICLFLTSISKQCRAISATWYIYSLHITTIVYGLILCIGLSTPAFYHSPGCIVLQSLYRLLQLLYSSGVVWVNIEVYRTIICPRPSWIRSKLKRFVWVIGFTLTLSLIVVIVGGALTFQNGCWSMSGFVVDVMIHILKNWIPGLAVIVLFILNTVGYVQLRLRGLASYNQFVENSPFAIYPTEWFICLALINIIFIIFEILFVHLSIFFFEMMRENLYVIHFIERVLLIMLGFPILALSSVRQTIYIFFRRPFSYGETIQVETQDINLDALEDESL